MIRLQILISALSLVMCCVAAHADPQTLYSENCAACHGDDRLGAIGPALIPQTLKRMRGPKLTHVIAKGREATQMPAFEDQLTKGQINELAQLINTPLKTIPQWGKEQINASLIVNEAYEPVGSPAWQADPMNITLAVETGDHHVSVLDGDTWDVLDRFATPFAVHGGPKFSPDGRYVYIMSRDGWVQKYDLWALKEIGRVRAGLNSRNIALSHDGKWIAVANYLPQTLTILSAEDLLVTEVMDIVSDDSNERSRVSAVYQAPQRESFILALKDAPEIWEVSTSPSKPPFELRRIKTKGPIDDFFFTPSYRYLIGAARDGDHGIVVDLDAGQETAILPLPGMPHLGSGITWERNGRRVMATPHLREGKLSIIDIDQWEVVDTITTEGPGFFLRSHEESPYVWADVFFGPNKDAMHVIDKNSLEIVKTLRPAKDATVAHVEFDRYGKYALVSVWEEDGALIIYDAKTLQEVRRLPMNKPSGKYNVWNKITFSEGTSH